MFYYTCLPKDPSDRGLFTSYLPSFYRTLIVPLTFLTGTYHPYSSVEHKSRSKQTKILLFIEYDPCPTSFRDTKDVIKGRPSVTPMVFISRVSDPSDLICVLLPPHKLQITVTQSFYVVEVDYPKRWDRSNGGTDFERDGESLQDLL